jgi:alpha-galactosidase
MLSANLVARAQDKQDPADKDWAKYSFYESGNAAVKDRPVAVLFGDSITRNWYRKDGEWLKYNNFLGRGISGQTTMHMLARFRQDVIELNPEYVVVLAGINDIARNNGYIKVGNTFKNIVSMVELAKAHGIKPVMCTVLPAREIGWRKRVGDPRPSIDSLNTLIRNYAEANNIPLADYHTAMKTEDGAMVPAYETDAVHPNIEGYKVMEKVLLETLGKVRTAQNGDYPVLTPPAPDTPKVNGPKVYGARPGAPFLYRIPATGIRPMRFSAEGLPKGLKLDTESGIISGKVKKAGTWKVTLKAENSLGSDVRTLKIIIGDKISLTPPLGWNSWNVWGNSVSQEKVLRSAKAMIESGLADCGWSYINIDDGWQGIRGGSGNAIQPNSKFPDMQALADEIHAMGLKFGIYSGPWLTTYAGHIGETCDNADGSYDFIVNGQVDSVFKIDRKKFDRKTRRYFGKYSFVEADVRQWAQWGVDYLKYDWYPNDEAHAREMAEALRKSGRDIVYSLSNRAPFAQAPVWAECSNAWRTTDDIRDTWESILSIGFRGQDRWAPYCGPGHWPDADMLVTGRVGWGPESRPSRLTADEQYSHISLWALLASPLLIGCDMENLDAFTIGLLSNTEVLDVNQDPLGVHASVVESAEGREVYAKPLEDGSIAIGLFNLGDSPCNVGFSLRSLGLHGAVSVRDLWRQKDLGTLEAGGRWDTEVASHGVILLKIKLITK